MASEDPYRTLGVSREASPEAIKEAYRDLAKKFHPDLNPGNKEAEQKFKEISAAYEAVGTPEARAKHDRGEEANASFSQGFRQGGPFYSQTQRSSGGGGRYSADVSDWFESFFGARDAGTRETADEVYGMRIDMKEAVLGGHREIVLPSGKKLRVKIPPGVSDGSRLRMAGQGTPGPRGPNDVYVELEISADPRFRAEGDDLWIDLPISLAEAVLGGEVSVPTLEGSALVRIPPHSNTGTRLRLAGKGRFNRAKKRRGDEIIRLEIRLPERIDSDLENVIRQWRERQREA